MGGILRLFDSGDGVRKELVEKGRVPQPKSSPTQRPVRFSHLGLVPDFECFDACSSPWGFYVNGSLKRLITTGEGPTKPPWS